MHYIRFLKPPRFVRSASGAGPATLSAKITITTDLGESFLAIDLALVVELEIDDGNGKRRIVDVPGLEYVWKGRNGMRALEVSVRVPLSKAKQAGRILKMLVRPKESRHTVDTFVDVLRGAGQEEEDEDAGGVVAVRSMDVYTSNNGVGMAERLFAEGKGDEKIEVCIWEETGESIARHIWYANRYVLFLFSTNLVP